MIFHKERNTPIYAVREWEVIEEFFDIENNYRSETIFSVGNGYIGMRGSFEEGYSGPLGTGAEGTYINGFYESWPISYGEIAYGYPEQGQTMVNVVNGKRIKLILEDESLDMCRGEVLSHRRSLHLKEGIFKRFLIWRSPKGREVKVEVERLVSLTNKHLAAIDYRVTPLNFDGEIKIISLLDGGYVEASLREKDPRIGGEWKGYCLPVEEKKVEKDFAFLLQRTKNTGFSLVCAMENDLKTDCSYTTEEIHGVLEAGLAYGIRGKAGKEIRLNKYIAYGTSRDYEQEKLAATAENIVKKGKEEGFEGLKQGQQQYLEKFWEKADVEIKGDPLLQQGIRFNIFHLLQSVGKDGKTNIAAKGLTGEGYEGHYFWDTEMYVVPFFLYSEPKISRKLLEYRYNALDKARERAREMSHRKGALFPWRTINGEECSAYYPAGTAQYHINADIAFAVKRYMEATKDEDFLIEQGAEILFETARLWADLGAFLEEKGNKFCINGVTGPDEYTAIVNNNCYTNLMARENLYYAYHTAVEMQEKYKDAFERIAGKIDLKEDEILFWKQAADHMYIPYHEKRKIHPQDDSFLEKKVWDFENTPKEKYPLLLHYHPLVIYRHQVCKQADLILGQFLLSHKFSHDQKKRDYDYYEKITTHDSSLSTCIFSIMACDIGYYEKAYAYFLETARMDLDDYKGNTQYGIHTANMAGSWMCIVNGFAGMRIYDDVIRFHPYIHPSWEAYSFKIAYRGRRVKVTISRKETIYELLEGEELWIWHKENRFLLRDRAVFYECL